MSTYYMASLIEPEQPPHIANPATAVRKVTQHNSVYPSVYEHEELQWGAPVGGSSDSPVGNNGTLPAPKDVETVNPLIIGEDNATELVQTLSNPRMNKWRLLSACFIRFAQGLNDGAPRALIPHMDSDYDIGYAVVSLIFVTNA